MLTFLSSFRKWAKHVATRVNNKIFLRFDLLFDPTPLMIELDRDIIMTNILRKYLEDWAKKCGPYSVIKIFFKI